ncbi:MAG: phage tail protein [Planctomycetota bacterium]
MSSASVLRSDCFLVEVDGVSRAGFARCSGLEATRNVFRYREGGLGSVRNFPGDLSFPAVILERGVASDRELWDWFQDGDLRDVFIVLIDAQGTERQRWRLDSAYPVRWSGPELDANATAVAVEQMEIVHEGLTCSR